MGGCPARFSAASSSLPEPPLVLSRFWAAGPRTLTVNLNQTVLGSSDPTPSRFTLRDANFRHTGGSFAKTGDKQFVVTMAGPPVANFGADVTSYSAGAGDVRTPDLQVLAPYSNQPYA
jgi:PKD repeat protein